MSLQVQELRNFKVDHYVTKLSEEEKKEEIRQGEFSNRVSEWSARFLRNLFFPLHKGSIPREFALNQMDSRFFMEQFRDENDQELSSIRKFFQVKDISVTVSYVNKAVHYQLRQFNTKEPIRGREFSFILFTFNENREQKSRETTPSKWNPMSLREASEAPLLILSALYEEIFFFKGFLDSL